jgi:uncharacterized protein YdeI (YjbR/CyaY-like superfamily)
MQPAGLKAFQQRKEDKSAIYSYEQGDAKLDDAFEQQFRTNKMAWEFFQKQTRSYRKAATWWVVSAKQEATRARRLAQLIEDSAQGRTVPPLTRPPRSKKE